MGDSYTWGEDVSDLDAQLQRLSGRRVLNGGGTGFDQTVLRTERLVERYKPEVVIVSFIADDIGRCEMRRMWWHDKPWFALEDGQLALKGVPVPKRAWRWPRLVQRVERIVFELSPVAQHVLGYNARAHRPGVGPKIALRLVERLARLQAESGAKIVVMAQYEPRAWVSRQLADEQRARTQPVLDHAVAGSPPSTRSVASPPSPGRASSIGRCT